MTTTDVDIDPTMLGIDEGLLNKARDLAGKDSNRDVINTALRLLIAAKQKKEMLEEMSKLTYLADELGAPTQHPDS